MSEKEVSLGIRGGGVKSAVGIGVLAALEKLQIRVSEITGDSMGSVIAALYATGHTIGQITQLFKEYSITFSEATRLRAGTGSHIIETSLNLACGNKTMKETYIPLTISANIGGFITPKPYYFDSFKTPLVPIGTACRASSSFPYLYEHFKYEGQRFWDGGMVASPPTPRFDLTKEFVLASFETKSKRKVYANSLERAEREADVIIRPKLEMGTLGNPADVEEAICLGYVEAMKKLSQFN